MPSKTFIWNCTALWRYWLPHDSFTGQSHTCFSKTAKTRCYFYVLYSDINNHEAMTLPQTQIFEIKTTLDYNYAITTTNNFCISKYNHTSMYLLIDLPNDTHIMNLKEKINWKSAKKQKKPHCNFRAINKSKLIRAINKFHSQLATSISPKPHRNTLTLLDLRLVYTSLLMCCDKSVCRIISTKKPILVVQISFQCNLLENTMLYFSKTLVMYLLRPCLVTAAEYCLWFYFP